MDVSKPTEDPLHQGVLSGPDFFLHKLDVVAERALFVTLSRHQFAAASFLDDRVLTPQTPGAWYRLDHLARVVADLELALPLHFIFHMGHVGSTLLSRLVEGAGGVLALREPLTLRTLAEAHDDFGAAHALVGDAQFSALVRIQLRLWRRGYADTRAVSIKGTSATSRVASTLLAAAPDARAVFLSLKPEPYLATLLSGENTHLDLRGMGRERMRRLIHMSEVGAPAPLHRLSPGELAGLTWAVETLTRMRAMDEVGARIWALDFDALLADPPTHIAAVLAHIGLATESDYIAGITEHAAFSSYSKSPGAPYSPALRASILAETRKRASAEISKGLAFVEALAERTPALGVAF